jgi:hypothetical protein
MYAKALTEIEGALFPKEFSQYSNGKSTCIRFIYCVTVFVIDLD